MNVFNHLVSRILQAAFVGVLLVAAVLSLPSRATCAPQVESLPMSKPQAVGFSKDLSQKIRDAVQAHIDKGDTPGAIVLVARNGRIAYWDAQGVVDAKTKMPLEKDTVFWVASMTKPVVTVSVLMMMETGKISLDDPVSKFIPEFGAAAKVKVLKPGSPQPQQGPPDPNAPKPQYDIVPASRPITVKDLLTQTSGIQTIGVAKEELPVYHDGDTLASWVPKLGSVPLDFQPGTKWAYSNAAGFDVLARIVEVTSGQPFNQFVQQRIFEPLGIEGSSFGPGRILRRAPWFSKVRWQRIHVSPVKPSSAVPPACGCPPTTTGAFPRCS